MSDELKTCPFCGSGARIENGPPELWYAECTDCGISGKIRYSKEAAIAAWNHRAPAAPTVQPDADPNAPWLTLAHAICTDAGVAHGFIADRLEQLRDRITPAVQEPMNCREAGPGKGLCIECANGRYERCLYVVPALQSPAIPPGYALVPIEPTQEMINNAADFNIDDVNGGSVGCDLVYKAMLAASPNQFHKK